MQVIRPAKCNDRKPGCCSDRASISCHDGLAVAAISETEQRRHGNLKLLPQLSQQLMELFASVKQDLIMFSVHEIMKTRKT